MDILAHPSAPDTRYCTYCGASLAENSLYCHKCGQKRIDETLTQNNVCGASTSSRVNLTIPHFEKKKSTNKWIVPVLIIFCFLSVILLNMERLKATFIYDVTLLQSNNLSMFVGDTQEISYHTNPRDISTDIIWTSSDMSIAHVSGKGIVTAKDEGTATITASIRGIEKDSFEVDVSYRPVSIDNGEFVVYPAWFDYPEVTIIAPLHENCFVYFEHVSNEDLDFAFYVSAGSTATVNAPAGQYDFYYASGETWYGKELKFGKNTSYYKSPDKMTLEQDDTSYDVLTLTLYSVMNGNMDTDPIKENEFPI